jgi:hypothetical protein
VRGLFTGQLQAKIVSLGRVVPLYQFRIVLSFSMYTHLYFPCRRSGLLLSGADTHEYERNEQSEYAIEAFPYAGRVIRVIRYALATLVTPPPLCYHLRREELTEEKRRNTCR